MFDFHMHSVVSFDGHNTAAELLQAAEEKGLREICFTDHRDYMPWQPEQPYVYDLEVYAREYDSLSSSTLKIRRGMEFGLLPDNQQTLAQDVMQRQYDFVLGSVHFVQGVDVYFHQFWEGKTRLQAERRHLEETFTCVRAHDGFDVLAHLNFVSKARANVSRENMRYCDHAELIDEILKELARKGKGLEMNTSGVDRCGGFLPTAEVFRRFKELGGQIVTVGSDAHRSDRVGQYSTEACEILKDIFGYVCTFEERKPIFHKL